MARRWCRAAAAVLAVTALTGCGQAPGTLASDLTTRSGGASSQPTPSSGTVLDLAIGSPTSALPFVDQSGRTVTLASLHGTTVVLADFLTLCQEVCPLTSANLKLVDESLQRAGLGSDVQILEVTVDPGRDDPARLAAYQKLFGARPNWSFLTGTPEHVAALWKAMGVGYDRIPEPAGAPPTDWLTGKPLTYDVDHQDIVFVIDPDGHTRWLVDGTPHVPGASAVPSTLQSFLNDDGLANESTAPDPSWTAADVLRAIGYVTGHPLG